MFHSMLSFLRSLFAQELYLLIQFLKMKEFWKVITILFWCSWYVNKPVSGHEIYRVVPGKPKHLLNVALNNSENISLLISFNDSNTLFGFQRGHGGKVFLTVYAKPNTSYEMTMTISDKNHSFTINMLQCPPGLVFSPTTKMCTCTPSYPKHNILQCNNSDFSAKIFVGFCVSSGENNTLLITRCPFANQIHSIYTPLTNKSNSNQLDFCKSIHREGKLCSKCLHNYGVSVFSDTYECIKPCKNRWANIAKYLAVEFIPTTIFFLLILYFHIAVTTGPANGFIFFGQMITVPIEVIFLRYGLQIFFIGNPNENHYTNALEQVIIAPYSIWNLEFYRIFNASVCLSEDLKVINILALRYVSAIYPLILLLIAYFFIELQAMNIRPIVWLWKIVCFPCTRWRRVWKAKTSIVDAFATCALLSYNKFMYVSFLLLAHSDVYGQKDKVLNFDPSVTFFSKEHVRYVVLSVIIILLFGIFPPLLLTSYQFKHCKSCLERLKLRQPGFEQFIDTFQGCYKDGTDGTADRRYFAGLYFVFRVMMLLVFSQSKDVVTLLTYKAVVSITFLFICAVSQPYKKGIYTFIDCLFFALMAAIATIQVYIYIRLKQNEELPRTFLLYYFLLYVPLLYMICYVARWLFLCYKNRDSNPYVIHQNPDGGFREPVMKETDEGRSPVNIDISFRPSITRTEVSIAELSQERCSSDSENVSASEEEASPLMKKRREMEIFTQYGSSLVDS